MEVVMHTDQRTLFQKVLQVFILSLFIATVGLYVGQYIPPIMMLPLIGLELGMLIAAFWLRRKKAVGYSFVYAFTFITGITTYPIVANYASKFGAQVVLMAFASTLGIFVVLGFVGSKTKKDLSFLSTILLVSLLALVFVSLFSLFSPLNTSGLLAFSVIGTIVFSLYIVYDFNQMKHRGITENMIPMLALSLYLDFLNLFINLLRMIGILSRD